MRLAGFVAVEIIPHLVAERNDPEQLLRRGEIALPARIEILHHAAELGEVLPHAGFLIHRAHRAIEEAVGLAGGVADLLRAHRGDRIDALAEFGRVGVLRHELRDEMVDPLLQLAFGAVVDGDQPGGFLRGDGRHRIGRRQLQRELVGGRLGGGRHVFLQRCASMTRPRRAFNCVAYVTRWRAGSTAMNWARAHFGTADTITPVESGSVPAI